MHIYTVAEGGSGLSEGTSTETPALSEIAVLVRPDRVYAVAVDSEGLQVAVGGRDKCVALYEVGQQPSSPGQREEELRPVWTNSSSEFVYAVSCSRNMSYCAYGGMSRAVIVCDGKTGAPLVSYDAGGVVWAIAFSPVVGTLPDGGSYVHIACGGEFGATSVLKLACELSQGAPGHVVSEVLQLPVEDTVATA